MFYSISEPGNPVWIAILIMGCIYLISLSGLCVSLLFSGAIDIIKGR